MMSLLTKASFFVMATTGGTTGSTDDAADSGWNITTFLNNLKDHLSTWGAALVAVLGIAMLIVGIFNIAKGMMGGGRGQVNWVLNIALIVVGGALAFSGGWELLTDISTGTGQSLKDLGGEAPDADGSMINNLRMWL